MGRLCRTALTAALTVAVALTAACGSDSATAPADPVVDLASLDVGNQTTQPKFYDKPVSIEHAKLMEALRLAGYIPLPSEVDPEVKYPAQTMSVTVRTFIDFGSAAIHNRLDTDPAVLRAAAPGFMSGFVTSGKSDEKISLAYELENLVLLFTDEQSAAAAAPALGQADFDSTPGAQRVPIDKYPAAYALAEPKDGGPLRSWYATGRFVILTYVYDSVMGEIKERDLPKLVTRVQRSLDVIPPAIAKFPATPQDKLMDIPVDPDGVLARALPTVLADSAQAGIPGVYDRHGGLQVVQGADEEKLFDEAGVDRVAWKGNYIYRARDAAGAAKIVEAHSATSRLFRPVASPPNLPNAKCRKYTGPAFGAISHYCYVSYGRFAAEVSANQLLDAQQRIAAQYAILVNAH
ncbi:hypothetical protein OHB26_06485 [Nocardia sp. NBC_01503]|uniref:DUF7373 family lipoprotein n=1 Tax=Nocardia sp. NBC_01503 TaxID=2975997 RepID=UPI002E7B1407|nr:hypothetical protein [Nocardia sp. NBC_01503]WTL33861.1 hypothetical protein OHB26_06485 [Nocardia sp. NBC_01503]